jgi:hypothetical protein
VMLNVGELWRLDCGDNLPWLESLPAGYASLTLTSPPYTDARTYGIAFKLSGQTWVDWLVPRVVQMARVTDGLVCVNMAGPVRDHRYSPVVEWLVADLTRHHGLVCGPAPYAYFRIGIPGSGGPNYHRRDWEPVYCFARPECLPLKFSDNTAMGHPPKWAPGGEMSNRLSDADAGEREWRPIADAPKDGTEVILAVGPWVGTGYYVPRDSTYGDEWYPTNNHPTDSWGGPLYPTHWQPLPSPPPPARAAAEEK